MNKADKIVAITEASIQGQELMKEAYRVGCKLGGVRAGKHFVVGVMAATIANIKQIQSARDDK